MRNTLRYAVVAGLATVTAACAHGAAATPPAAARAAQAAPAPSAQHRAAPPADLLGGSASAVLEDPELAGLQDRLSAIESEADFVSDLDNLIEDTPDTEVIGEPHAAPAAEPAGVPLVYNARVQKLINYFQGRGRERFEVWLSRSGAYVPMMQKILVDEGLPPDLVYLALIESGFSPYARSHASAVGYWQFINATGRRYGLKIDDYIDERRNPEKATRAAARYLKDLYGLFGDWHLAAAGYNAGEGKIARAIRKYDTTNFWQLIEGRYLKPETKEYVPKLIAAITIAKNPAAYGFNPQYHDPFTHGVVMVAGGEDMRRLAYAAGVTFHALKRLNPELRRWVTPPSHPYYALNVPVGSEAGFAERLAEAPDDGGYPFRQVTLGKNDSLEKIAALYNISVADLKLANPGLKVKPGAVVTVPVGDDGVRYAERPPKQRYKTRLVVKVKRGDTLSSIARRYRVSPSTLAEYNGISGPLKAGQRIKIPGKSAPKKVYRAAAKKGAKAAKR